jgi:hypothetical protein
VEIYELLTQRFPADPDLADGLASAKFRWRVAQLPEPVRRAAVAGELQRGDFAVLLYWLVPQVRYGQPATARIASDILDDPRREEIARVVNQGLMDVDPTVHQFGPERPLRRERALRALVRLLVAAGIPCAPEAEPAEAEALCGAAVACGLVHGPQACFAGEGMTGIEAVDLLRHTLDLLGAP